MIYKNGKYIKGYYKGKYEHYILQKIEENNGQYNHTRECEYTDNECDEDISPALNIDDTGDKLTSWKNIKEIYKVERKLTTDDNYY